MLSIGLSHYFQIALISNQSSLGLKTLKAIPSDQTTAKQGMDGGSSLPIKGFVTSNGYNSP